MAGREGDMQSVSQGHDSLKSESQTKRFCLPLFAFQLNHTVFALEADTEDLPILISCCSIGLVGCLLPPGCCHTEGLGLLSPIFSLTFNY